MATLNYQSLRELVEASDIAIRVASQLRQAEAGRPVRDQDAMTRAIEFLENAKTGGSFMAGEAANSHFGNTLQPLNWATDTFLAAQNVEPSDIPDYGEIAEYIQQILETVNSLNKGKGVHPERLKKATSFFDTLGSLLASRADRSMRRESVRIELGTGV